MNQKVFIAGNLANRPLLEKSETGEAFTYLTLTTNRFSWMRGHWMRVTDWHFVLVRGPSAEASHRHLEIGFPLAIDGYLAKNVVIAEEVHFLGLRNIVESTPAAPKKGTDD